MAGSVELTVLAGALLVTVATSAAGCRQAPPPPPKAVSIDIEPLAKAREAMDRHDYGVAVVLLREAVRERPDDLEAHYRLGVSASHLDHEEETGKEFEWVMAHAVPGAPEVQLARDWLAARTSGTLATPTPATQARPSAGAGPSAPNPVLASLAGRAIGPDGVKSRLRLLLKGVAGTPVQDGYHILRTDEQGHFRFADVVPGDYMLTNTIAGAPTWRLRVSLAKGEQRVLDLSPANQASVRDDFPEPRS